MRMTITRHSPRLAGISLLATLAAASPAYAHHPLGGMPMETFAHGVLSGIGHPVLGFDHLFFVALVGVAAIYSGRALIAPLGYVAGMLAGCALMMAGVAMPIAEIVIGASLLVLGYVVLSGRALSFETALLTFAGFGLFHGSAFGESIVGQEGGASAAVVTGYLLGLAAVQYAIAIAAGFVVEKVLKAVTAQAVEARLAGAVVAGIGLFLSLENAEGVVFDLLGWAT
ncbi:MAG: HupE/UreJ family protein [Pseudomonadota bacterium]